MRSITDPVFGWKWLTYEDHLIASIGRHPAEALMDDYPPEFFERTDNLYYNRKPQKHMDVHFKAHFVSRGTFFPKKVLSSNGAFERRLIAHTDTLALRDSDLPGNGHVADTSLYSRRKGWKVLTPAFVRLMTRNYGYDIE